MELSKHEIAILVGALQTLDHLEEISVAEFDLLNKLKADMESK